MVPALLVAVAFLSHAYARPSSYAVWSADSAISRGQGNGLNCTNSTVVSYEHGEFQVGLELLYAKTGNVTYYNYIKTAVDSIISSSGGVQGGYT
jgi:hypothetical protein